MTVYMTKRMYATASTEDSYRVLVDRLWPRGVSKQKAALGEWAKQIAPTTELLKWFGHDPAKYREFRRRYVKELEANPELPPLIQSWQTHAVVTLLYGTEDSVCNEAVVLCDYLHEHN